MNKSLANIEAVEGVPQDFYYQVEEIELKQLSQETHNIRLSKHFKYCIGFAVETDYVVNSEFGLEFQERQIIEMLPDRFLRLNEHLEMKYNFLPIEFLSENEVVSVKTKNFQNIDKTVKIIFLLSNFPQTRKIRKYGAERIKVLTAPLISHRLNLLSNAKKINAITLITSTQFSEFKVYDNYFTYLENFKIHFIPSIEFLNNEKSLIPITIDNMDLYIDIKNVLITPPIFPYVWFVYEYDDNIDLKEKR